MKLHLYLVDAVAAASVAGLAGYAMVERQPASWWVVIPLALALGGPVAVRRRWPLTAHAVVLAATAVAVVSRVYPIPALGVPVAAVCSTLYLVGVQRPRRYSMPALGAAVLVIGSLAGGEVPNSLAVGVAMIAAWAFGDTMQWRRALHAEESTRQTERTVSDERLRIARELHDIVAHNLSLIAVKASTAAHVRSSDEAFAALRVISETSRGALAEMRHLLGVLRSDPELAPAPGLAGLPELVDRAAMAGVKVELDVRGELDVPEGVGLSAYRIVQEAITNVVKHAAPAACTVVLEDADGVLRIEVTDDGPGGELNSGHGLLGMRERVMMYHGTFQAGPRAAGGFQVRAELPYR